MPEQGPSPNRERGARLQLLARREGHPHGRRLATPFLGTALQPTGPAALSLGTCRVPGPPGALASQLRQLPFLPSGGDTGQGRRLACGQSTERRRSEASPVPCGWAAASQSSKGEHRLPPRVTNPVVGHAFSRARAELSLRVVPGAWKPFEAKSLLTQERDSLTANSLK